MKLLRGETFLLKISYDDWCLLGPAAHLLSGSVPATQTQGRAVGRSENPGVNNEHNWETFLLKISYDDWCLLGPAAHLLSGSVPATQTQGRAVGRSENPGVNGGHNLPPLIEEKLSCSRFLMMTGACSALPLTCSLVRFRRLKLKAGP